MISNKWWELRTAFLSICALQSVIEGSPFLLCAKCCGWTKQSACLHYWARVWFPTGQSRWPATGTQEWGKSSTQPNWFCRCHSTLQKTCWLIIYITFIIQIVLSRWSHKLTLGCKFRSKYFLYISFLVYSLIKKICNLFM